MACGIHIGDTGTILECTIVDCQEPPQLIDVSSATVLKEISLRRPDRTTMVKVAIFKTDGTDGIIQYESLETDFDVKGTWSIQARVQLSDGTWFSEKDTFTVDDNL